MAVNVELKTRVRDLDLVRANAAAIAAGPPRIIGQRDTFFVVPRGRLKVRAFADGSGELIAYERADERGPRQSTYTRVECADAAALCDALARVLVVRGVVLKRRELFMAGRARIHLDVVESLGSFVELEVVLAEGDSLERGHREARDLLKALGIPEDALVPDAYIDLLERRP